MTRQFICPKINTKRQDLSMRRGRGSLVYLEGIERAINVVVCQNENLYGIQRTLIWSGSLYVLTIYR